MHRYWKFTASKRWDQQKHKKPSSASPPPRPTGAPKEALQEQLAGLRRKAAFRRVSRRNAPEAAQGRFLHTLRLHAQAMLHGLASNAGTLCRSVAWLHALWNNGLALALALARERRLCIRACAKLCCPQVYNIWRILQMRLAAPRAHPRAHLRRAVLQQGRQGARKERARGTPVPAMSHMTMS